MAHRPLVRHSQQLSSVTPGYHLMDGLDQMLPSTWALTVQDVWFSQKETQHMGPIPLVTGKAR